MDGYLYNRDPFREASALYYVPVYQRRSSYVLHPSDSIASYSRVPIDPYAGYGAAASYLPEVVLPPRYASNPPPFRSRHRPSPKKRPPPAHNLGPKKKPFKQTHKVSFSEENGRNSKKSVQKKLLQNPKGVDKPDTKARKESNFQVSSLVKETKELHSLYRTGVDGKNSEESARKKDGRKASSTKRKAETQMQNSTPAKKVAKKKQKQKKTKSSKNKKSKKPAPVEKVEPTPLTEEEKKEDEAGLELQRGMCESVSEFLGVPTVVENPESKEVLDESEADVKPEDAKEADKSLKPEEPQHAEKPLKPEEPQLTPEEEKEIEEKSFKFFSKMFVECKELRNLYIEKCNAGSFECLVCRSIEAKSSRRFWNLASLVMHTNMRKQMRFEHRGYGRSISAVLGWDPNKTPKVPCLTRLIPTDEKATNQVKVDIKSDMENKTVDKEENVADVNASDQVQDENAAEVPSKDSKEE